MIAQNWINVLANSLQNLWQIVVNFLPSLVGSLLVLIVGLIVASGLERLVERLVFYLKIDAALRKLGVEMHLERANLKLDAGMFLGTVVYWFILLAFLLAASDILGFGALSGFISDVLLYIPNVIVAAFIVLAAVVVANMLKGLVMASVMGAKLHAAKFMGLLTWWTVVIFGLLTAAVQLNIAVAVINTVITGLVAMMALAGGLAFGLGGRDAAMRWVEKLEGEVNHQA